LVLENKGFHVHDVKFSRGFKDFSTDVKLIRRVFSKFKNQSSLNLNFITPRLILVGLFATTCIKKSKLIFSFSGLGFIAENRVRLILYRFLLFFLCKINQLKGNQLAGIFQNNFDKKFFSFLFQENFLIPGSGINTNKWSPDYLPEAKKINFVFASRLLSSKGIFELKESIIRMDNSIDFVIVGDVDHSNPSSISKKDLDILKSLKNVSILPFTTDLISVYNNKSYAVLPSYREGIPRTLIEACSLGLPILTTNVPGCNSCVSLAEENGVLVKEKSTNSLFKGIQMILSKNRIKMSIESRKLALNAFDIRVIEKKYILAFQFFKD
jgi:glycosyltransferase involved in cell wall biosynthesis